MENSGTNLDNSELFFGLQFKEDFPFDSEKRRNLALMLFANPGTYPGEAIMLLRNTYLPNIMDQLKESLLVEIKMSEVEIEYKDLYNPGFKERLFDKLYSWVKAFTFPFPEELAEIPRIFTSISEPEVFSMLTKIAVDGEITPEKILEYLSKYASLLPVKAVDDCLDTYNNAILVINKVGSIQLKLPLEW